MLKKIKNQASSSKELFIFLKVTPKKKKIGSYSHKIILEFS
jgi:hypothetical protein